MSDGIDALIDLALHEDLGYQDITTNALFEEHATASARIVAKEPFVLAGMDVFVRVFDRLGASITVISALDDGAAVDTGTVITRLSGPVRALLTGERTALNFLQRLSGVATYTRRVTDSVKQYPVRVVDTRKTTPGLRYLEKAAVRAGGGFNHRFGLFDGVLIKDNHIQAAGSIAKAVEQAIQLSEEKYCSVSATVRGMAQVTTSYEIK